MEGKKIKNKMEGKDDYEEITDKVLYKENKDKLEEYSLEEFMSKSKQKRKDIFKEVGINFKFVLTFGTSITAFYPLIESFILSSGLEGIDLTKETIVYLTICSLAIVFENPKEIYKKLFTELRLRNVYKYLKDITLLIEKMTELFNFFTKRFSKFIYDVVGMFNYTSFFVPFALTLSELVDKHSINLSSIIDAILKDGVMKISSMAIGITGITLRELLLELFNYLRDFKLENFVESISDSFSKIKSQVYSVISHLKEKIKGEEIQYELEQKETDSDKRDTILKWKEWKNRNDFEDDVERIDEIEN